MRTTSRRKARSATSATTEKPTAREQRAAMGDRPASEFAGDDRLATDTPAETSVKRTAYTFTEDGRFDTDAMRSANRERLRTALQDPTLFERLGLQSPAAAAAPTKRIDIPPELFLAASKMLTDTIAKIGVVVAHRQGFPPEEAMKLLMSQQDHDVLDPLLVKALEDWCPTIEGKYVSLYMLGAGALSVYAPKFMSMKKPGEVVSFPQAVKPATTEQPS